MGHLIRDVLFPFFPYLISLFLSVEINKTLTPDLTSNMWHQNTAFLHSNGIYMATDEQISSKL